MSSVNDSSLDLTVITNRRTTTLAMDLQTDRSRSFDLTLNQWGGLDFDPDFVVLKYVAYSSQNSNPSDAMPILTCDFIDGDILAPYLARTSIQSFNIMHKVHFQNSKQKALITSKTIRDEEQDMTYNRGTVLVALEWLKYLRKDPFSCGY